jgi:DNA-binding response OmpR family regulator
MMLRAAGGTHAFWKRKIRNLMLPMLDGWEVCRRLRQASEVPVIMLTARAEEVDRGAGLTLGADD